MRSAIAAISIVLLGFTAIAQERLDTLLTVPLDSVSVSALATICFVIPPKYIISKQLSKTNPSASLTQRLQQLSGVYIRSNGTSGLNTASIKGLGSMQTPVLINGANMQSSMNGVMDLSLIDPIHFNDISVEQASSSLGIQNMGNSVSLKTRNSSNPSVECNIGTSSQLDKSIAVAYRNGTYNWKYSLSGAGVISPNQVNLGHYGIDSLQSNTDYRKMSIVQTIGYRVYDKYNWSNTIYIQSSDRALPARFYEVTSSRQQDLNLMMHNSFGKSWKKGWSMAVNNQLWREQINYVDSKKSTAYLSAVNNINSGLIVRKKWDEGLLGIFELGNENAYYTSDAIAEGAKWNRVRLGYTLIKDFKKLKTEIKQQVFLYDDKLKMSGGLSLGYRLKKSFLSLAIQKVFRLPTLNELFWYQPGLAIGNKNLKSEDGYKVDVYGRIRMRAVNLLVNPYGGYYQNWILWGGFPVIVPRNIPAVWTRGAIVQIDYQKTIKKNSIAIVSNINWSRSTYDWEDKGDTRQGKQLIYTPELTANVTMSLARKKMGVQLSEQYVGVNYVASDNSAKLNSYFLTEVGGYYQLGKWRTGLAISNLWNTSYFTQPNTPLPGRIIKFNINYKLPIKQWKEN